MQLDSATMLARLITDYPDRYHELHTFNFFLIDYWHPEWAKRLWPQGFNADIKDRHSRAWLATFILRQLNLDTQFCFNESAPGMIIALQDTKQLQQRFIPLLGALRCGQQICQAVSRQEVYAWRQSLGETLHAFVLRRAPLLPELLPLEKPEHIRFEADALRPWIFFQGEHWLRQASFELSGAIGGRLRLKLTPVDTPHHEQTPDWALIERISEEIG